MASATKINTQLLDPARKAREVLYPVRLVEKAERRPGPFTDAHDRLDRAIKAAEQEMQKQRDCPSAVSS